MGPAETDPALFPLGGCRDVVLEGAKTQLVPFREAMVETYAAWMQNEDLLHLTGTDGPMSPADVENMRKLYHEDPYSEKALFLFLHSLLLLLARANGHRLNG
eukprot:GHVT01078898.1.p3 GENE.GHVT01078898.1~~GHVT01078898.1.p3  ORF type:complete len:102 (-),score=15.36 GHVT01078898.1:1474-1779(-)